MITSWISAAEARALFSQKYTNEEHGQQIFCRCLELDLVRARGVVVKDRSGIGSYFPVLLLENGEINSELWDDAEFNNERSWRRSEFRFKGGWEAETCLIEDVEFSRADIINIHSRKGVGGRPPKAEWEAVTHILVDIAMSGKAGEYKKADDLINAILLQLDDEALSQESLKPVVERIYKQHFLRRK